MIWNELQELINNKESYQFHEFEEKVKEISSKYDKSYNWLAQSFAKSNDLDIVKFREWIYSFFDPSVIEEYKRVKKFSFRLVLRYIYFGFTHEIPKCELCGKEHIDIGREGVVGYKLIDDLTEDDIKSGYRPLVCETCWRKHPKALEIKSIITRYNTLQKYGVDNVSKLKEVKEKISTYRKQHKEEEQKKREQTIKEKYGVSNVMHNEEIRSKWKQTIESEEYKQKLSKAQRKRWSKIDPDYKEEIYKKIKQARKLEWYEATNKTLREIFGVEIYEPTPENYENRKSITKVKCLKCGLVIDIVKKYQSFECPKCKNRFRSKYEIELESYLKEYVSHIIPNAKNIVDNYEIDLWIPEKKLAIEFNGIYWHSELFKSNDYHQKKFLRFEQEGIRLVQIWEHEYFHNKPILLEWLKSLLLPNITIYGRNVVIEEINNKDYEQFLKTYHLQGYAPASIKLGMYYDNELVSIFGISKSRFRKDDSYELIRLATKFGYRIVGLLDKFTAYIKNNYNISSIISYVDLCKFTGSSFDKSKYWKLEKITKPSYFYIHSNDSKFNIITRYQAQKHNLPNLLRDHYDPKLSEVENMRNAGFLRIFDCGTKVYVADLE